MRVCFVSRRYFPAISGMSVYAQNLLRELVRQGHDVTMISQYRGDEEGTKVYGGGPPPEVPGVRVIGLEALGEQDGGDFERDIGTMVETVLAEHAREPFDVLHAQYGYPTGLAVLEASKRTGVPNVVSIQGGDGHWVGSCCGTHELAMRIVLDHAGALLIGSRSFAQEVIDRLHVTDRFTVVPGAVDTDRFSVEPRRQAPVSHILYHGRVDRRKGVLDFLEALAVLQQQGGVEFRATVSGIGPDYQAAKNLRRKLGLHRLVGFAGYADYDAAPARYHDADVFASPTYAEGFSNTILEAMASGVPVLAGRAVGVVDCIRDEENGLLVEPGDVEGIAAALRRLLTDEALRTRLRDSALEEVRSTYSWTPVGEQIAGIYENLRGTAPDTGWTAPQTIEPCRFRAAPHLL